MSRRPEIPSPCEGEGQGEGGIPRILFSTGTVYVYPLRAAFRLAREAGCDGVELVVSPELMLRGPAPIGRLARDLGVPIGAIHPPLFGFPGWRSEAQALPRLVDLALALGIPTIVIHPPKALAWGDPLLAAFVAQLDCARTRLTGTPVRVTLENPGFFHPRDRLFPLWHPEALARFAEAEEVGITLDTTHAGSSPYPLLETCAALRRRLAHIHLSDYRRPAPALDHPPLYTYVKHHQIPGTGSLPLPAFLGALARDGYRGDITLELSPVSLEIWRPARARERLAEAVAVTRRMLGEGMMRDT